MRAKKNVNIKYLDYMYNNKSYFVSYRVIH